MPRRIRSYPPFRYEFLNDRGRVLQAPQTSWYKLRPTDVGATGVRRRETAADPVGESFSDTDGWHVDWTIVSLEVTVQKATWTRIDESSADPYWTSDTPNPEDTQDTATKDVRFRFVATPAAKTAHAVEVRETYSDAKVVHWTGMTSRAFPASPPGTTNRPPIVLGSSATGGHPYGWIAAALVAIVAVGVAVGVAGRARASFRASER